MAVGAQVSVRQMLLNNFREELTQFLTCNHSAILDLSCFGRDEERHGYEMGLDLVSGANFRCVLLHFSSLTRYNKSKGQVWLRNGRKRPTLKLCFLLLGLIATKVH